LRFLKPGFRRTVRCAVPRRTVDATDLSGAWADRGRPRHRQPPAAPHDSSLKGDVMREILSDLEGAPSLSDPDPVRRAQIQMKTHLPKRFYEAVSVVPGEGGFAVHLDGKAVRTPAKALL